MSIRSILTVFNGVKEELPVLKTACDLAEVHQARLIVLHVLPDPSVYKGFYAGKTIFNSMQAENQQRQKEAEGLFSALVQERSLPVLKDPKSASAGVTSICFLSRIGMMEPIVAREGRFSDLIVLPRNTSDTTVNDFEDAFTASVFYTGRPLLLLSAMKPVLPLDHTVAIAWKDKKEAVRAIAGAMPFLSRAKNVHLLVAHEPGEEETSASEQGFLTYLKLQGISPEFHLLKEGGDAAPALLKKTRELKAGLLVMGAYGHNRFREIIFGGVTEHMLYHADLPVLMAH